jgi:tRNA(Ile)-lysidine synthase
VAASGGMDSTVLVHLLMEIKVDIGLAHVNYGLRGKDSDKDMVFVQKLGSAFGLPVFTTLCDTTKFGKKNIQLGARNFRYTWFRKLMEDEGYDLIATGHHCRDVLETMLINQIRGTGISGLHGIIPKKNGLIRPLLEFNREEIEGYCQRNRIPFRKDSSNEKLDYLRNKIRHTVFPVLKEINPEVERTFYENSLRIRHYEEMADHLFADFLKRHSGERSGKLYIDKKAFESFQNPFELIYLCLRSYGFRRSFNTALIGQMPTSGKKFYSDTHCLTVDRDHYILEVLGTRISERKNIEITGDWEWNHIRFKGRIIDQKQFLIAGKKRGDGFFDLSRCTGDSIVRNWKKGDKIKPLGMRTYKLLSDIFIDNKVPQPEKRDWPVVVVNGEVAWLPGLVVSEKFKVSKGTKQVLHIIPATKF